MRRYTYVCVKILMSDDIQKAYFGLYHQLLNVYTSVPQADVSKDELILFNMSFVFHN